MENDCWLKNDICWCVNPEEECPYTDCFRHTKNMTSDLTWYAGANLKSTNSCPHKDDFQKGSDAN